MNKSTDCIQKVLILTYLLLQIAVLNKSFRIYLTKKSTKYKDLNVLF
jgi:membrane-anchored glycerophosphoryl diester phosphodiesterase (GDPDase)